MVAVDEADKRSTAVGREWACLLAILLATYSLIDSLYVSIPATQRGLFAVILAVALISAVAVSSRAVLTSSAFRTVAALILIITTGSIGVIDQSPRYWIYIFGDAATIGLIVLFIVFGAGVSTFFVSRGVVMALSAIELVSALLSRVVGVENGRFDPPSPFLIGATIGLAFSGRGSSRVIIALIVLILLSFLAYQSGFRTHVLLVFFGILIVLTRLVSMRTVLVLAGLAVLTIVLNLSAITGWLSEQTVISSSRFRELAAGQTDQSILERTLEVKDVWLTSLEGWQPYNWITGSGHGATYVPTESFIIRNITSENRVHNIHVGPVLLLFRYGAIGLVAYLLLLYVTIRQTVKMSFSSRTCANTNPFFPWIVLMFLFDFLVRNVLIDPFFAYAVAGLVSAGLITSKSPDDGSGAANGEHSVLQQPLDLSGFNAKNQPNV
mgnify:CR=1 FL=1